MNEEVKKPFTYFRNHLGDYSVFFNESNNDEKFIMWVKDKDLAELTVNNLNDAVKSSELEELLNKYEAQQSFLTSLNNSYDKLQSELAKSESLQVLKNQKITELWNELATEKRLREELRLASEMSITWQKGKIEELEEQLANAVSTLNRKEEQLASVKSELEEWKKSSAVIQKSLNDQIARHQDEMKKMSDANVELESDNKRLRDVVEGIKNCNKIDGLIRFPSHNDQHYLVEWNEIEKLIASLESK